MPAVRVSKGDAEKIKELLKKLNLYDGKRRPERGEDFILLPVLDPEKVKRLGFEIIDAELPLRPERQIFKNLESILKDKFPESELRYLRRYDIIGDIAIIQIPPEVGHRQKDIIEALLALHPSLKVIAKKGFHEGTFRIRRHEIIWGEKRLITVHKENGVKIKVNLEKAFFNPRMKGERYRLAQCVKDGENILLLFAGVLPYALVIAKYRDVEITAVELNDEAVKIGLENIKINKLKGKIEVIQGDVFEIVPELGYFDRVISPTPKGVDALSLALSKIKSGWLHYYNFVHENDIQKFRNHILNECRKLGKSCKVFVKKVSDFKPHVLKVCADVKVKG